MRRIAFIALALLVAGLAFAGDTTRTLNFTKSAEGIQAVVLEAGVGDVEIIAGKDASVTAEVTLEISKKSWSFGQSKRELDALELDSEVKAGTLYLSVRGGRDDDRGYGEDWSIQLPKTVAVECQARRRRGEDPRPHR